MGMLESVLPILKEVNIAKFPEMFTAIVMVGMCLYFLQDSYKQIVIRQDRLLEVGVEQLDASKNIANTLAQIRQDLHVQVLSARPRDQHEG